MHFHESVLIDTVDGFHCKTYSNHHPEGKIIVKPKYIPSDIIKGEGLKRRFIFSRCMTRLNLFAKKEKVNDNINQLRKRFPDYFLDTGSTWFFVIPKDKIMKVHDPRQGLKELLEVPRKDLDNYLLAVVDLIELLTKSGVKKQDLGITHSTLMGNYTPGISDIDMIIFGKENGWKILDFLKTATHPKLKWKTRGEWIRYYQEHRTAESGHFTEEEYADHMLKKFYEGTFDGNVFTLFTVEEPDEMWNDFDAESYEPQGTAEVEGTVTDDHDSIVRPACYKIEGNVIGKDIKVKQVVTYSLPFMHQARKGDRIKACGLLEKVTPKDGDQYHRLTIGYFDAYTTDRREKEYLKVT
ncbi:MAG: hypothetical protein KJ709_00900 [Nanoarchaeota archaeon]|nr:hypothetical protein [Nanoarchaeota archaeon]